MGIIIPMERIVKKLRNGEFISREAALEAAKKSHLYFDLKPIINSIPSADVRPVVRGEWEKTEGFDEYGGGRYVEWTCSVCFSKAKGGWAVRDKHIDEPPYWNYCPNCGADMRAEEGE